MARPVDLNIYRDLLPTSPPATAQAVPQTTPAQAGGPQIAIIEALLEEGAFERAAPLIAAGIAADPGEARFWFLQARVLAARGRTIEAQEACRRAIALWPDILPVYRLLSDLAGQATAQPQGEDAAWNLLVGTARRMLLAQQPDDAALANRIASGLCAEGRFEAALPYLRMAAPVLGHQDSALWNYTTSLALTGGYHELLAIEPMLANYARDVPSPFGPFAHLAGAKLAQHADRAAVLREISRLQASPRWLDANQLAAHLADAIAERRPFSVVALSEAHARLVTYASVRAHLLLTEAEMSAVVDSVWHDAFGGTIESHGAAQAASLCRRLLSAIATADVIALPDANHLALAHQDFGFLAETQRIALLDSGAYAGLDVFAEMHAAMPYLRPLLASQPFLGFVGFYPDLAARLGRFADMGETVTYTVPAALNRIDAPEALRGSTHFPAALERTLTDLVVPYPGAIFLVGAGLLGTIYCGRIRDLGGIAIDIDRIVTGWMRR